LGTHSATSSSINGLPPFISRHYTHLVFVASNHALEFKLFRESLREKERLERVQKRVRSKESEQKLKD
jgi:hypothetical protein